MRKYIAALAAVSLLALLQVSVFAATGEITLSGTTWTGKVDGVTKYTGTDLFACANAVINAMSSGTVNLRNSGSSGASGGSVKAINLKSSITFNGNGCTINANTTDHLIVPIQADRKSTIGVQNLRVTGAPRYSIWLKGCNGMTLSGINIETTIGSGWLGIRIDNSTASTSSANIGSPHASGCSEGVETYGLSGFSCGTVTAHDNTECGLLLNQSSSCTVGTVNATKCNYGGGYAGFRTANNNRSTTVTTVNSVSCGRGFFSVSGSSGCTVSTCNASNCSGIGIWLQSTRNTHVNGGIVKNNAGGCSSISQDLGGNSINVSCQ